MSPARLSSAKKRELKASMFRRGQTCYWCSQRLEEHTATLDHLIPISRGGTNARGNQVLACRPCNAARKDQTVMDLVAAELATAQEET